MNFFKKNHLLVFILLSSFLTAFGQSGSSSIEPAVDDAEYKRIIERIINSSNFFPNYTDLTLLMVLAKKDITLRNARAKELFELAPVQKKLIEYDEGHYLDPEKYNKEILEWLKENL